MQSQILHILSIIGSSLALFVVISTVPTQVQDVLVPDLVLMAAHFYHHLKISSRRPQRQNFLSEDHQCNFALQKPVHLKSVVLTRLLECLVQPFFWLVQLLVLPIIILAAALLPPIHLFFFSIVQLRYSDRTCVDLMHTTGMFFVIFERMIILRKLETTKTKVCTPHKMKKL